MRFIGVGRVYIPGLYGEDWREGSVRDHWDGGNRAGRAHSAAAVAREGGDRVVCGRERGGGAGGGGTRGGYRGQRSAGLWDGLREAAARAAGGRGDDRDAAQRAPRGRNGGAGVGSP